jgi:hypothetical protein
MLWSAVLATSLAAGPGAGGPPAPISISVDSSKHELTITAGPYDLPNMPPMKGHGMDGGMWHHTLTQNFEWPVDGWCRGYRVDLVDAHDQPVPRSILHHMFMVNFSRRQLIYPVAERLLGAGTETDHEVSVPKTIGVPLSPPMRMGIVVAWHNDTGKDLEGVFLKLTMLWTPKNQNPRPVNSMPLYMDVSLVIGGTSVYDLPPGKSTKSYEFTLPVGGRLLGVGGHVHDYGVQVWLEDAETGKVVSSVVATRDSAGHVSKVSQKLYGVKGDGLKLKANHRYRVVGEYDNPTGETLVNGAMAHLVGLFVPEDMTKWPAIDPSDTLYQKDLATLNAPGTGGEMEGMHHGGPDDMQMDHTGHGEHGAHTGDTDHPGTQ